MKLTAPYYFNDTKFAELNKELFDAYVELRVHGRHPHHSFRMVFGEDNVDQNVQKRIDHLESGEYYIAKFKERLEAIQTGDLWNDKIAVHEMLAIARDPYAKDSTRLNAMKELNILVGITVVDENGKTKLGGSLEDFYRSFTPGLDQTSSPTNQK